MNDGAQLARQMGSVADLDGLEAEGFGTLARLLLFPRTSVPPPAPGFQARRVLIHQGRIPGWVGTVRLDPAALPDVDTHHRVSHPQSSGPRCLFSLGLSPSCGGDRRWGPAGPQTRL